MINNRQGGRRRGRGGGPRTPNNAPNIGNNRPDNRSRGNAAQLHEKYKSLARDAQMGGDRVQTEYYLQFADHYFRVLSENRPRFDEQQQRPRRDDFNSYEDEDGEDQGVEGSEEQAERQPRFERQPRQDRERADRPERQERPERQDRYERQDRQPRYEREQGREEREPQREERPELVEAQETVRDEGRPRRANGLRPRRPRREDADGEGAEERIALDVLPPAISVVAENDEAPKPVRRRSTRRPRTDDDEIAPAA